jgi:hypothetical protein
MVQTPPILPPLSTHCPVLAQVNHCTSFVRGLRPHLWRRGNISFGHIYGVPGWVGTVLFCVQEESYI